MAKPPGLLEKSAELPSLCHLSWDSSRRASGTDTRVSRPTGAGPSQGSTHGQTHRDGPQVSTTGPLAYSVIRPVRLSPGYCAGNQMWQICLPQLTGQEGGRGANKTPTREGEAPADTALGQVHQHFLLPFPLWESGEVLDCTVSPPHSYTDTLPPGGGLETGPWGGT